MSSQFKKIRSVLDRRELWHQAASLVDHLCVIKIDPDNACPGSVSKITPEGVWIQLDESSLERRYFKKLESQLPFEILGYLTLKEDRYYFLGKITQARDLRLSPLSMEVYLPFQFEMFKLDRRSNFRVKLPDSDQFEVKIFECNGKSLNLLARVKDVSGGGLRLLCNEADAACTLEINNKIKGELYPTKDKIIQFEGVIRHLKRSEGVIEFGVMIVEEHIKSSFRLTALTLTLQRKLIVPSY